MEIQFNPIEVRVLGALIEKETATPDYYPLTLNSLINACNQKSSRDPVMDLDEAQVEAALDSLRNQRLVWQVKVQGSRVVKYEQNMKNITDFSKSELALLCVLMLRGPQTAGELRTRTTRLIEFHGLSAVEHSLQKLVDHENGPFVLKMPRQPGQKECRYAHLFCPINEPDKTDDHDEMAYEAERGDSEKNRIQILEQQVENLYAEMNELREQFLEFKKEFE
jgi:uncharacterized protein YceH (UPF0502 family)